MTSSNLIIERDHSISCLRLLAFLCIFFCHIFQYYGNTLAWWFNVGTQVFLVISGFLYGKKNISNILQFYKKQFTKILVPYYMVVIPVSVFLILKLGLMEIGKEVLLALICRPTLPGGGHLWYISTILLCYTITPVFQYIIGGGGK